MSHAGVRTQRMLKPRMRCSWPDICGRTELLDIAQSLKLLPGIILLKSCSVIEVFERLRVDKAR